MKTWIYGWLIYPPLYCLAALLGLIKPKVRDTLRLRSWKDFLSLRFNVGQPIEYWIHVASHGELEYAIPILHELSRRGKRVLITYYSISAKRPVEQLPLTFSNVSLVVPLPHDGMGLMREFVTLARRQGVHRLLLMKYELWPGLLWECNAHGIKVILVDALKPSWFHRRLLHKLDGILSGYSSEIASLDHPLVKVVGDTRVERVLERVERSEAQLLDVVPKTLRVDLQSKPVLVCGSMWPPDTKLVLNALGLFKARGGDCHLIWVPHELEEGEAQRAIAGFRNAEFKVLKIEDADGAAKSLSGDALAIIVLKKGILAELYRLGQAAFVGGAFGSGVHSVWEPALTGARVACGPRTRRAPEAGELSLQGILERVETPEQLCQWFEKTLKSRNPGFVSGAVPESGVPKAGAVLPDLLKQHLGAAKRIIQVCEEM